MIQNAIDENDWPVVGRAKVQRAANIEILLSHHSKEWIAENVAADPNVKEVKILRVPGQEVDLAEAIRHG
ncbi:MAG: hypothetical protein HZY75_15730 [Nocardioidaceae bacterium]|nr:MAG: hypothetical protein HZY75_15730 [Nocardioidaceae bacterium]